MESAIRDKAQQSGRLGVAALRSILAQALQLLMEISGERAAIKPTPNQWSPKEELGHLLDSASNNHQRLVRAQLRRPASAAGLQRRCLGRTSRISASRLARIDRHLAGS